MKNESPDAKMLHDATKKRHKRTSTKKQLARINKNRRRRRKENREAKMKGQGPPIRRQGPEIGRLTLEEKHLVAAKYIEHQYDMRKVAKDTGLRRGTVYNLVMKDEECRARLAEMRNGLAHEAIMSANETLQSITGNARANIADFITVTADGEIEFKNPPYELWANVSEFHGRTERSAPKIKMYNSLDAKKLMALHHNLLSAEGPGGMRPGIQVPPNVVINFIDAPEPEQPEDTAKAKK